MYARWLDGDLSKQRLMPRAHRYSRKVRHMSTYSYKSLYIINKGPSLDRLADSLKYCAQGGHDRIKVEFTLWDTNEEDGQGTMILTAEVCGMKVIGKNGLLALDLVAEHGTVEDMSYNPSGRIGDLWLTMRA